MYNEVYIASFYTILCLQFLMISLSVLFGNYSIKSLYSQIAVSLRASGFTDSDSQKPKKSNFLTMVNFKISRLRVRKEGVVERRKKCSCVCVRACVCICVYICACVCVSLGVASQETSSPSRS